MLGDFGAAEEAYGEASRRGREPQPGLALLRLAQREPDAAAAAIRRALVETAEISKRAKLLPACVEIMLAAGDLGAARDASDELGSLADGYEQGALAAMAAQAQGAVELAEGDAAAALTPLRHAGEAWQQLEAPYETARVRELVGLACRALGDEDTAALELAAATAAFAELGASPDVTRIVSHTSPAPDQAHGLTGRELEVLRLVAAGKSNREIAAALVISEHTVARHLQNIFAKLGLSSRTAATAFAFDHGLV